MKKVLAIVLALALCLCSVAALAAVEDFVGVWETEDGTTAALVLEDGTFIMAVGEQSQETTWTVDEDGNAQLVLGPGSSVPMIINDDGNLEVQADNMTLIFLPVNPFVGDWITEDESYMMTVNEDGTVVMSVGEQTQETTWTVDDEGNVMFTLGPGSSVPMIIDEEGKLQILADNMTLVFVPVVIEAE